MTAMTPSVLPNKTPAEQVSVYLQLGPLVGTDAITAVTFGSDPTGLDITYQSILDGGQTAAALVGGGTANTRYALFATCTLTSGQVYQPVVALPVVEIGSETRVSRAVVL